MSKPKKHEKRRKWGVIWIFLGTLWFVNTKKDALKCGVWCGVSTGRLNDPKALRTISAS